MKINATTTAISEFEKAAINHALATEQGNHKVANKNYDLIVKSVAFLKKHNALGELYELLSHNSPYVQVAAATFLLSTHEIESTNILSEIANTKGILGLTAELVLSEWRKGHLKL